MGEWENGVVSEGEECRGVGVEGSLFLLFLLLICC
jgi:hypothetical protein